MSNFQLYMQDSCSSCGLGCYSRPQVKDTCRAVALLLRLVLIIFCRVKVTCNTFSSTCVKGISLRVVLTRLDYFNPSTRVEINLRPTSQIKMPS